MTAQVGYMKIRFSFIVLILLALSIVFGSQVQAAGKKRIPQEKMTALQATVDDLVKKCEQQGSGQGWIYVTYQDEMPGDNGLDPVTGVKLPVHSKWQIWYQLDSEGKQEQMISRREDLETGNVWIATYRYGKVYAYPAGYKTVTVFSAPGNVYPLKERCAALDTFLKEGLQNPAESTITTRFLKDDSGQIIREFVQETKRTEPVEMEIGGRIQSIVGSKVIFLRNDQNGLPVSSAYYVTTDEGNLILTGRYFDFSLSVVPDLPDEVKSILNWPSEVDQP